MPADPLAYFITFRCHGTWLHGDSRGWVDRSNRTFGTPMGQRDDLRLGWEQRQLQSNPRSLDDASRAATDDAIREVCRRREWGLLAINVRTNHVHAVVAADCRPEQVMQSLKAAATRELRARGLAAPNDRLWSRHGSTVYLWREADVDSASRYVIESQ